MIFIPGNVPSVKNTKSYTSHGVFHSKTVKKYLQKIGVKHYRPREMKNRKTGVIKPKLEEHKKQPNFFKLSVGNYFDNITYPALIGVHFIRGTRHAADFHNLCQIIFDLLSAHDFIEDDDMSHVIPIPLFIDGKAFTFGKENPGVYIKIIKKKKAQEISNLLSLEEGKKDGLLD